MDAYITRESITRRTRKNGDEYDAFGPGRRVLACLVNHPTGVRNTKRTAARRARREIARTLRYDAR